MATRTLLYATDYSEASEAAFDYAVRLARDLGARLVIAHVSENELMPVGEAVDEVPAPNAEELARLREIKPRGDHGPVEYKLLYAEPTCQSIDPAREIIRFADQARVEAIVVGTHGRRGLTRALCGSVAEQLVRRAHCPVVTVRQQCAAAPLGDEVGEAWTS